MALDEKTFDTLGMLGVLAAAVLFAAAALLIPATPWDLRLLDSLFALQRERPATAAQDKVVVVGIDLPATKAIAEPMTLWHRQLGRFLEGMREARPAVVGIDLVLPERSYDSVAPGIDSALVRGLLLSRTAFPTILAKTADEGGHPRPIYPAFAGAAGTSPGYALWHMDADGVMRRFTERLGEGGETVPTLSGQMARVFGKEPREGYLDFALGRPFDFVPFADVLAAIDRGDGAFLRERFEGKAVLLGVVMPFLDVVRVPVPLAAWGPAADATPGVLLQAQAVRVHLADRMLAPVPPLYVALLAALVALASGATARLVPGSLIAWALIAAVLIGAARAVAAGHVLPVVLVVGGSMAAWSARQGASVLGRLYERHRLRKSFSGYVSPAVLDEILKGRLSPGANGELRYVCLLFSDIRGYTTRSETMQPGELLAFLNQYFDGVVDIIHRHGGTVTCFMGDGIMAVFGAPKALENPCASAFDAARDMLENLKAENRRLAGEGSPPIDVGIGLHAGEAVMGHVGGHQRHDYSAIGDVINVASRLEGATKGAGYRVVVSEEVAGKLPEEVALAPLGPLDLKGHTPVVGFGYDAVAQPAETVRS